MKPQIAWFYLHEAPLISCSLALTSTELSVYYRSGRMQFASPSQANCSIDCCIPSGYRTQCQIYSYTMTNKYCSNNICVFRLLCSNINKVSGEAMKSLICFCNMLSYESCYSLEHSLADSGICRDRDYMIIIINMHLSCFSPPQKAEALSSIM